MTVALQKSSLNAEDDESETSLSEFRAVQIRGRERRAPKAPKKNRRKKRTPLRMDFLSLEAVPEVDENQFVTEDDQPPECCSINKFLCIACIAGSFLLFVFFMILFYYK